MQHELANETGTKAIENAKIKIGFKSEFSSGLKKKRYKFPGLPVLQGRITK
jgi:hypothetical protein